MKKLITLPTILLLTILLAGCSTSNPFAKEATPTPVAMAQPTATPEPQVLSTPADASSSRPGDLTYNAEILAEAQVPVVAEVAGQVLDILVDVGDEVQQGDLLVQIDPTLLEAQRAQAEAGLMAAQAQLDMTRSEPKEADLEAARAAVKAAEAAYQRALEGATEDDRRLALIQVRQAEEAVKLAQSQYDRIAGDPFAAMRPEALQLQQATFNLEAAKTQYEKVLKGATPDQIAGAYAQLAGAKAQLARLEEGASEEQIRAAEAQVKQAEAALFLAQTQVDKAAVKAPVDGVVAQVMTAEGAMAGPGTPLLALLAPGVKLIVSVEEARIPDVRIGQPAVITVAAYPGQEFPGEVTAISPALDPATRTLPVTIRPTEDAPELKPGMLATVTLLGD
jgi:multidrug efflux pump subunit AcrA (membrane-fusion protein)